MRTFDDYQEAAARTRVYPEGAVILYPALGLAGEAGEVAEKVADAAPEAAPSTLRLAGHAGQVANQVKKIIRDDDCEVTPERLTKIAKELGGVMWYVAALCTDLGLNLGDVCRANAEDLARRQNVGTLQGDGDNR